MSTQQRYIGRRLFPELFEPKVHQDWLDPRFIQLVERFKQLAALPAAEDPASRDKILAELCSSELGFMHHSDEVYSFPVFSQHFITQFNQEIANFYASGLPARRPNSMNNYGIIVNEIGMRPMITAFQQECLLPITRVLFPDIGSEFDEHHSFIVRC